MTTIVMCRKCSGAIVGSGSSYAGRRCTCDSGSVATMADSAATGAGHKLCCKCGKDVTHDRRMKDHLHRYWCYECGASDQLMKGQGVSMICPDCKKHFRPTHMLKHGEDYICESCHAEREKHHGLLGIVHRGKGGGGKIGKTLLALLLVGVGAALILAYAMGIFP